MQRLPKDPPIGKGGRFQLRPGLVHRNSIGTGWKRIVRTVRYALQNSFAGPSRSGASVERTRQALRRQSMLLHGAAQSHPRILLVSCAQTSRYFVRSKWAACLNRYRSCSRQVAIKFRLLLPLTENTDTSIVRLNYLTSDGETQSCPLTLVPRTPIEFVEYPGLFLFSQARP
jgi:hypothetical protein